jgi:O-methyltransferase
MTLLKKIFKNPSKNSKGDLDSQKTELSDLTDFEKSVIERVRPFTMTSSTRIVSLIRAVQYLVKNNIKGDIIECGVWKGGSILTVLETLLSCKETSRRIYLCDTFEGMPPPSDLDKSYDGISANKQLKELDKLTSNVWAYSTIEEVKNNISKVLYPADKISFIKGKVENTLQQLSVDQIALLRLDTDWYESTRVELELLYPKLVVGGVMIIDDYGHWQGARKAVDEYIEKHKLKIFLSRIDYTARLAIKIQ